jgi:hypothetical protein
MPWNLFGKIRDVAGKVWSKVIKPGINALAPTIDKYVPGIAGAANAFLPGLGAAVESGWSSINGKAMGTGRLKPELDSEKSRRFGLRRDAGPNFS